MTKAEFLPIYNRLTVALRDGGDDSGVTQGIYFEVLRTIPLQSVQDAAGAFARESGRKFMPTTAEWHGEASRAATADVRKRLTSGRDEPWHCSCNKCDDTGWEYLDCAGDANCGRVKAHAPHAFVRVCPCRPTNQTYQRHAKFGAGA